MVELVKLEQCAAFIGAGTSIPVGYPSLPNLIGELAREAGLNELAEKDVSKDWMDDLQQIKDELGLERYQDCLVQIFDSRSKDQKFHPILLNILAIPFCAFVTTNYDRCLEFAVRQSPIASPKIPFTYPDLPATDLKGKHIFHIHGRIDETDPKSVETVILARDDYDQAYRGHKSTSIFLQALFSELDVVFIGFGWTDFVVLEAIEKAREWTQAKDEFAHDRNIPRLRQRYKFAILDDETFEKDRGEDNHIGKFGVTPIIYSKPFGSHDPLHDIIEDIQERTSKIPIGPMPTIPEDYLGTGGRDE